ncbi:response regulator, partial [candidate division KSB1 bacterium]|nr:response regulator [candidate division KSB1 bacterium]
MTTSKPKHILYIEDDAVMARLTQMKLEKLNYLVDIARDG